MNIGVFLQESYMLNSLSPKAGIRVVIHPVDSLPIPQERGLDVAPNTAASFGLQRVQIRTRK